MGQFYSAPAKKEVKWYNDFEETIPSLSGKVIAITGCTTGTGFVAARTCAKKGATVLMLNRKSERSEEALKKIKEEFPESEVVWVECDLQSFKSVRAAAAEIKKKYSGGIDVLCNNAGMMMMDSQTGEDGYDLEEIGLGGKRLTRGWQMTVNHLSHFLLTKELFPLLSKKAESTGDARIVNHSSGARKRPEKKLDPEYLSKKTTDLGGNDLNSRITRYQQTKLSNCVFTFALHDKLQAKNSKVKVLVAHPGLSATNLQASLTYGRGGGGGGRTRTRM
ncbi:hypothetical protein GUITHDRAFT_83106 [Guillardia theta CCMP2712]|uniref:Uncharacterized protein n=1 Tax=Guillardia theta (strain CCMP2712) TaxID=905079 RepID=L1I6H2_GUITC|nr:hypothetical protein GUITHDRAFT_83106 [Guillardia theta CCMP2712]EKX31465.1 hypothetical protein GUITHDRAFT_83106 [Guillardia theta CCMP2712]|eukprot:XP_005818445.1 hypothetical protein GUITHDRAFT_83106 [Guillardia theta CCMP2712]